MLPELFLKYSQIFKENGYSLYMIGGSSRDYLLGKFFTDYDFVTDATPDEMSSFLNNIDTSFAKYGSIRVTNEPYEIDITTLREEGEYLDYRHPSYIKFIKDIKNDSKRRDFTVNALYIDETGKIFDFYGGLADLKNKTLRFIGNPLSRIKEDPLRILRIKRFSESLDFNIEEETLRIVEDNKDLLKQINPEKINLELKKCSKRK